MKNITIIYEKFNKQYFISNSNDDIEIKFIEEDLHTHKKSSLILNPLSTNIVLKKVFIKENIEFKDNEQYFLNGYQTWTDSFLANKNTKLRGVKGIPNCLLKKYAFDKYGDYTFYDYKNKRGIFHSYTYTYILNRNCFYGSLNDQFAYTIFEYDIMNNFLNINADLTNYILKKTITALSFVTVYDNIEKAFEIYGSYIKPYRINKKMTGYTSWYNYYQDINEDKILHSIDIAAKNRYDLFQIDDGYQTFVGDWMSIDDKKFPNGLKSIVDNIKNNNMIPGIWLAPFIAEEKSSLFKNHPDFFLRDDNNNFIKAGSNWSGFYVLDISIPAVKDYIKNSLEFFINLGFTFFKLDFLYAVNLKPKNKSRSEILTEGMLFIRNLLKDCIILSCGTPLANSFSIVDYARVGCDVSLKYDDVFYMHYMHRERISTKNNILSTINRSELDGLAFYNDPDVFIMRNENNHLSKSSKQMLTIVNHLFGSLTLTSDDVDQYDEETKQFFNEIKCLKYAQNIKKEVLNKWIIKVSYQIDGENKTIIFNLKKGRYYYG